MSINESSKNTIFSMLDWHLCKRNEHGVACSIAMNHITFTFGGKEEYLVVSCQHFCKDINSMWVNSIIFNTLIFDSR